MKRLTEFRPNFLMLIACMVLALLFLGAFVYTSVTVEEAVGMETIYTEIN